jgi:hypothetical protein
MSFDNHKKILVYYFEYKEKFLVKQSISSFIFYQLDTEYLKKYIYNIYNFRIIIDKYLNQNRKWIIFTNYRKLKKKF